MRPHTFWFFAGSLAIAAKGLCIWPAKAIRSVALGVVVTALAQSVIARFALGSCRAAFRGAFDSTDVCLVPDPARASSGARSGRDLDVLHH